ncbi:hypothetical protein VPH35_041407 [Triticum aestivum]
MDAASESAVTCVDFWANGFGMRARIALRELGAAFEYVEEDLVRRMNPIHRSVPILIHRGRPVFPTQTRFLKSKEKDAAKEELVEQLKRLEEVLSDKGYFSGDEFGFLDIVLIPFSSMFRGYEQHGGFDLEVECPNLMRWVKRCKERESVREVLPDEAKMYDLHKEWYGIE